MLDHAAGLALGLGAGAIAQGVRAFHGRPDRDEFLDSWSGPVWVVVGEHESRAGVALVGSWVRHGALQLRAGLDVARTVETALAMGFAVDETADMSGGFWEATTAEKSFHHAQWDRGEVAFDRYAGLLATGGPTAALGRHKVGLWQELLEHLADQGRGLVLGGWAVGARPSCRLPRRQPLQ